MPSREKLVNVCPECLGCSKNIISTIEFESVCTDCGYVFQEPVLAGVPFLHCSLSSSRGKCYKAVFHFNERCALFTMEDPVIPDEMFELIEREAWATYHSDQEDCLVFSYPHPEDLTREDIRRILRSITVPSYLEETFFEHPRCKKRSVSMCRKYLEKWLTIKKRLSGKSPYKSDGLVDPPWQLVKGLKESFACIPTVFYRRLYGDKRRNLPNYNLLFAALLCRLGHPEYIPYFPMLKSPTKLINAVEMVREIFDDLRWSFPSLLEDVSLLQNIHNMTYSKDSSASETESPQEQDPFLLHFQRELEAALLG